MIIFMILILLACILPLLYICLLVLVGYYYSERGSKFWFSDGTTSLINHKHKVLHRIGKPAKISHFYDFFYENGQIHNLNGPAVIQHIWLFRTKKEYYLYNKHIGTNLSKKEFKRLKNIKLKELVFS